MAADPINAGSVISTLLRAQSVQPVSQTNKLFKPTIDQVANSAKPTNIQPNLKTLTPSSDLPRGSLVDILA